MNPLDDSPLENQLFKQFDTLPALSIDEAWEAALTSKIASKSSKGKPERQLWQPALIFTILLINLGFAFGILTQENRESDQRKAALQLVSRELLFDNNPSNN